MKLKKLICLLALLFTFMGNLLAIDYPVQLKKYVSATRKYMRNPDEKNEANFNKVFQKTLESNPELACCIWQLRGEAYYHCDKREGNKYDLAYEAYTKGAESAPEAFGPVKSICVYNLALMYMKGNHVEKDYAKCFQLAKESYDIDKLSLPILSVLYRFGLGVEKDEEKAYELYHEALRNGTDVISDIYSLQYQIAHQETPEDEEAAALYERGLLAISLGEDSATIISNMKNSAEMNYPPAITAMAEFYLHGMHGLEKDIKTAEELAAKAASMDYVHGIFIYANVVERSTWGKAFQWDRMKKYWELYSESAEKGHPVGQYVVGIVYSGENLILSKNLKVTPNASMAYEWFAKSAESGWQYAVVKELAYRKFKK